MKRFAVSILFDELSTGHRKLMMRLGVVFAHSHNEAIGVFLKMKREEPEIKNASSVMELVVEIDTLNEPGNDPETNE